MKQNYFIVDGKKYYTGTVFIIKNHKGIPVEASFVYYDVDQKLYVYKIGECRHMWSDKYFWSWFVGITDRVDNSVHMPVVKTMKDREVDGLFIGWVWYIFLMLVSAIFNDAIGLWIFISVVFFSWRSKKIKEEGTYIEW